MVQYNTDAILNMADKLFLQLNNMTESVDNLDAELAVYKKTVEEKKNKKSEEVIRKMRGLITEIREQIYIKTNFIRNGTTILKEVEGIDSEGIN